MEGFRCVDIAAEEELVGFIDPFQASLSACAVLFFINAHSTVIPPTQSRIVCMLTAAYRAGASDAMQATALLIRRTGLADVAYMPPRFSVVRFA